jgi:mRNA interferase MazF
MPFKRGEVLLALFPDSNLRTAKKRPVLAIQSDSMNSGLSQTIVAMITSNMARAAHPSRVTVLLSSPTSVGTGLVSDSVIMTDNLATVLDSEIDRSIGAIPNMGDVNTALKHSLGL